MNGLIVAGRNVGPGSPALLIAEVAQAHDGSLGMAHAFIDAAADAGADAVKFQTHIAAAGRGFFSSQRLTVRLNAMHQRLSDAARGGRA